MFRRNTAKMSMIHSSIPANKSINWQTSFYPANFNSNVLLMLERFSLNLFKLTHSLGCFPLQENRNKSKVETWKNILICHNNKTESIWNRQQNINSGTNVSDREDI